MPNTSKRCLTSHEEEFYKLISITLAFVQMLAATIFLVGSCFFYEKTQTEKVIQIRHEGGTKKEIMAPQPIPVPTPYQSPQYGGNPYLKPGTTGAALPAASFPMASYGPGQTLFSTGQVYPTNTIDPNRVLSAQTTDTAPYSPVQPTPTPTTTTNTNTTTNNGGFNINDFPGYAGWDPAVAYQDWLSTGGAGKTGGGGGEDQYAALRGEISSGWDSYINSLNDQIGGLGGQRDARTGTVQNQFQQGMNNLGLQKSQGMQELGAQRTKVDANQTKTLRDLSGNLRNSFMAGNIYLGTRGAGDSSAANQYSYALTKEGTRQRTDVMNQTAGIKAEIDARETNLNNIYNTETNNLALERDSKINEVAEWYNSSINQIKQMQAQGQLGKSQDLASLSKDILNQGIQKMNQIDQYLMGKKQMLDQWAMENSKNISELRTNMQAVSGFTANLPKAGPIAGQPQVDSGGNFRVAMGGQGGYSDENKNRLFSGMGSNYGLT